MKKMNQFMMGMLAIAATSFVSCSNEDATSSNASKQSVDNFYMNLQVVGNSSNGTRTTGTPTEDGTTEESKITNGTIWLVDASGAVKFSKYISESEWNVNTVKNPIKVAVTQVDENTPYTVYFLANKQGTLNTSPTTQTFTSGTGGIDYATDNAFVMFNQNDKAVKANSYTVTFTAANKEETNPATPSGGDIKLDRLVARIDVPTTVTTITKDAVKTDRTDNIEAISGLTFNGFATSNLANKSNVEQKWDDAWTTLQLPDGLTYYWDKASYGTAKKADNLANFKAEKQYLFEQTTNDETKATSIYLQYTATASAGANKDFTDGTFYRYDKRVFTSIQDIIAYAGTANPFGTKTAAQVVDEIKDATSTTTDVKCTTNETTLETFRKAYNIEVFVAGKVYYKYAIEDPSHADYTVLRNSIYRIDVKNIYDLGSDTPNGEDEKVLPVYYLNVKVVVNDWVLRAIDVDLD